MKKILVTGGAGYIGSHTVIEILKDFNYDVIILDNFKNSSIFTLNDIKKIVKRPIKVYNIDCRDNLDIVFENNDIDAVIHFAAFKSVDESIRESLSYYDNNINSLINLLKTCKRYDVKNIIFSSSCSIYGDVKELPVDENTLIGEQKSPYAYTKLIGERILEDFFKSNPSFKIISLRYFNPVGAHDSGLLMDKSRSLLSIICKSVINKEDITIFGNDYNTKDGSCIRDYVHVVDIANAHYLSLEYIFNEMKSCYDVFNIGSSSGYSVIEMIKIFEKTNSVNLNKIYGDRRDGDIEKIYSNSDKANRILKWQPNKDIHDIVSSAWNCYNKKK